MKPGNKNSYKSLSDLKVNGKNFKSQFQNIKAFIKCRLNSTKIVLPLYEAN